MYQVEEDNVMIKGIPLLPFTNQVGGHTSFFRFSKRAICKPANERKEQEFYMYLERTHPELLPFLSNYLGLLNVTYYPQQFSLPEVIFEDNKQLLYWQQQQQQQQQQRQQDNSDILNQDFQQWSPNPDDYQRRFETFRKAVFNEILNPGALKERIRIVNAWEKENNYGSQQQDTNIARWQPRKIPNNPWSQQVYERDRQKFQQLDNVLKQFILLEDLTEGIEYPCVLDLKMGTRQYSVVSTELKKASQTRKCNESTSHLLGVRICGMQIYNQENGEFIFYDKYMGRRLNVEEFEEHLFLFLNNRIDFIPILLHKLKRLRRIIKSLKGYRFYGSSLLIIYDGNNNKKRYIDVRMIDFEKSVSPKEDMSLFKYPPIHINEPDPGYLLGLNTLIDCFNKFYTHI